MADTILVLDGIQFTKPDTADVYTVDGAGNSAVATYHVQLPQNAKAARVIFNAGNATASTKCHCRAKVTDTSSFTINPITGLVTLTKTANTQVLEWSTVTAPAVLESGDADISALFDASLHIDVCLSSTTAVVTGIEIIVQVRKEDSLDEWTTLAKFSGPIGTGVKSDFASEEAAGQTTLSITNPTTGKLNSIGKEIFLEDTATIAQCEIAFLVSTTGD